ncbi:MAG: MATE family efflux transporter, partial [Clostridium sp.]
MKNQEMLAKAPIGKLLIKYSVPAIIGMIVNALYNVVDRIFIGNIPNVGSLAITGVGVTMPIMTIILAFGMLVGIGATSVISIKLGQGKKEEAEKIIGNVITLSLIIGVVLSVLGLVFGENILNIFGASENTLYYAKSYIYIILGGTTFNILAFSLNNTIRADGNPRLAAIIMVVGCLTNIVLDAVFIFVFNMGIQGAALATVISQIITAIWALNYYVSGKSSLKFRKSSLKLDKKLVGIIFAIGLSPFMMQIAASLVQVIANNSLKVYGGDLAIGAMATISSVALLFLMPVFGIDQGSQPIIGFNYGAKQYDRAHKAVKLSMIAAVAILTVASIITQMFPEKIIGMFNKDPELMAVSVRGVKMYLLMLPLIGIAIPGSDFILAIGKAKLAMGLSILRQVVILIPVMLILPKFIGLDGVWIAQPISDFISVAITATVVILQMKSVGKEKSNSKSELIDKDL